MMGFLKIKTLRIGIDASNLRLGGGVTHLVELLRAVQPQALEIDRIVVWGGKKTLSLLEDRSWLDKHSPLALNRGLLRRMLWQRFCLAQAARKEKCDILFVPGGSYAGNFHPVVTMSRNLLPFQWRELRRYGWTLITLKMIVLRWIQAKSFRCVDGLIFLNQYAKSIVLNVTGLLPCESIVIPHGMHNRFKNPPRNQKFLDQYSLSKPYQIIYVSTIDVHKHQWHVAKAIAILRNEGCPLVINFIGPSYPRALKRLQAAQAQLDPGGSLLSIQAPFPILNLMSIMLPQIYVYLRPAVKICQIYFWREWLRDCR